MRAGEWMTLPCLSFLILRCSFFILLFAVFSVLSVDSVVNLLAQNRTPTVNIRLISWTSASFWRWRMSLQV
jgi:hypothetical protein